MKSKWFVWSSATAGLGSAVWVLLLATLVVRCKRLDQGFPVLAKFSPYRDHLNATSRMLQAFPILALLAIVLIGIAWYREKRFFPVRPAAIVVALSLLLSGLVIALNPGGYVSWFLS
ncbi:MAG TPA: hypothetical protein VL361_19725 [Candidatus Limnocylindrales bacterium]|jgi:hypothetical protein|nr:hypothetical protein [Candidatus Limnocylindrales bacterium]